MANSSVAIRDVSSYIKKIKTMIKPVIITRGNLVFMILRNSGLAARSKPGIGTNS